MLIRLLSTVTSLGLPDGAPGKLRRGAQAFAGLAVWFSAGTAVTWDDWGRPLLLVATAVAAMSAVTCWAVAIRDDKREDAFVAVIEGLAERLAQRDQRHLKAVD